MPSTSSSPSKSSPNSASRNSAAHFQEARRVQKCLLDSLQPLSFRKHDVSTLFFSQALQPATSRCTVASKLPAPPRFSVTSSLQKSALHQHCLTEDPGAPVPVEHPPLPESLPVRGPIRSGVANTNGTTSPPDRFCELRRRAASTSTCRIARAAIRFEMERETCREMRRLGQFQPSLVHQRSRSKGSTRIIALDGRRQAPQFLIRTLKSSSSPASRLALPFEDCVDA